MALKPARLQWSDDGSLESLDYGDVYFQRGKGLEETDYVFLQGNKLRQRFAALSGSFHIAELGFGSGLNFLMAVKLFLDAAPEHARLFFASVEKHPLQRDDVARVHANFPALAEISRALLAQYPPLVEGFHTLHMFGGRVQLLLGFGDVLDILPQLTGAFDAWFLDGFSPVKNPAMWEEKIYPLIAARTAAGGTLATFSSAGHVRRALGAAGFAQKKIKGYGIKWSMTVAAMPGEKPPAQNKTVAVLGAGIAGCSAAYAFARRGFKVELVDRRDGVALETSGNPAGILYAKLTVDASPMGAYHTHAFNYARQLVKALQLPSWRECGVLHLDMSGDDRARTGEMFARNEWPEDYAVKTAEGFCQQCAGFLSPVAFCAALAAHPNITRTNRTIGTPDDVNADIIVVALGNNSAQFSTTGWLPLQSLRGQVTLLKETAASAALDKVICHDGYITPAVGGLHCAGATFQKEEQGAAETRAEDDAENLQKLNAALPQLGFSEKYIAGSRSGYRAATPDKLPMVGPCPDYAATVEKFAGLRTGKEIGAAVPHHENLYISTGFGAHGMTGAPLAGEMIAAMACGETLPVPAALMEHLLPERFILRGLKRKKI